MPKIYFEKINKDVCDVSKSPEPAIRSVSPEWWSDIPRYMDTQVNKEVPFLHHRSNSTIKSCPAINDCFNFGYIIYLPFDIYLDATDPENLGWYVPDIDTTGLDRRSGENNFITYNSKKELHSFPVPDGYHSVVLKLNTLWGIKTEDGYSSWLTQPMYRYDLPLLAMDGVIDTDKYPSRFPHTFFVKSGFVGVIKASTPVIQIIPFKREDYTSEIVELDKENVKNNHEIQNVTFSNSYKKNFWTRKKFK
jgi:hypothetical protein